MIVLLTVDDVLRTHAGVIARSGGSSGVRDIGLVESAVAQPEMGFGGEDLYPTIATKAAALAFSLISNHAFVDGNKRIAHAAMDLFLVLNGWEIVDDVAEQEKLFLRLAAGQSSREELVEWIERRISAKTL